MKLTDRLMDYYNMVFYILCFGAIAASISYTFRMVRGSYQGYTLSDTNAVHFFFGALLIASALFAGVLRVLGPVAFSSAFLFWRYTGRPTIPRNPWASSTLWIALLIWGLLTVLLATILAPFSTTWLLGAAGTGILFGLVLTQWAAALQVLKTTYTHTLWCLLTAASGIALTVLTTLNPASTQANPALSWGILLALISLALLLTLTDTLRARKKPLTWEEATGADGRRALLLSALTSIGTPDGYRYYGSRNRRLQEKYKSITPTIISLTATLDSLHLALASLALSLPLGIFFATSYSHLGAGITAITGAWLIAILYRWHAREWTAQTSLRSWLGAPRLRTLLGFTAGPILASILYSAGMTLLFSLPWWLPATAALLSFYLALGSPKPPTHFNYDLTITTPDGLLLPIEPFIMIGGQLFLIALIAFLLYLGPTICLIFLTCMVSYNLASHYLGKSPLQVLYSYLSPR